MKKIALVFDGTNFSAGAFQFVKLMHEAEPVLVTGIFLPQVNFANLWSYAHGNNSPLYIPMLENNDRDTVQSNILQFEKLCRNNGMEYRVHKDFYDFAIPQLKKETRFADLVVLGSQTFYNNVDYQEPNEYLEDALNSVECPVVVVPESYSAPENNILAYDGSASSVYAIKMFVYLFPQLTKNKTLLVYASSNADKAIPEEQQIEELAAYQFNDLTVMKLELSSKKDFAAWVAEHENAILVSGSFGRSAFSQFINKSFVSEIIREHTLPVFITHR